MFRVYYHLYLGASWPEVWEMHRPELEAFATQSLFDRLILCVVGGGAASYPKLQFSGRCEIRRIAATDMIVNEFQTLQQMHRDASDPKQSFQYCAYMHSKGASSEILSPGGAEWSLFLSSALLRTLPSFPRIVNNGFNCLGSNLAMGVFEDFGTPRLHYSGNFWCATRDLISSAPEVSLGDRYSAVRHNAEWWLSKGGFARPFNVFATGLNHYRTMTGAVDWKRLQLRIAEVAVTDAPVGRAMEEIEFIEAMIRHATGGNRAREVVSQELRQRLPHYRWKVLLRFHDAVMRKLGSRKFTYFYCPETR